RRDVRQSAADRQAPAAGGKVAILPSSTAAPWRTALLVPVPNGPANRPPSRGSAGSPGGAASLPPGKRGCDRGCGTRPRDPPAPPERAVSGPPADWAARPLLDEFPGRRSAAGLPAAAARAGRSVLAQAATQEAGCPPVCAVARRTQAAAPALSPGPSIRF